MDTGRAEMNDPLIAKGRYEDRTGHVYESDIKQSDVGIVTGCSIFAVGAAVIFAGMMVGIFWR